MSRSVSCVAMLALCVACADGVAGREKCRTEQECLLYADTGIHILDIESIRRVDAAVPLEPLPIVNQTAGSACVAGEACEPQITLARAVGEAVWATPDPDDTDSMVDLVAPPDGPQAAHGYTASGRSRDERHAVVER